MMLFQSIAVLILLICTSRVNAVSKTSRIVLMNNKFYHILVAISPEVEEDATLIKRIKDVFTKGSQYLHIATQNRSAFGEITILVPNTWKTDQSYQKATNQIYGNADVVIVSPRPATVPTNGPAQKDGSDVDDVPEASTQPIRRSSPSDSKAHTQSYAGCGYPGLRISLTSDILTNLSLKTAFGLPERVLVHEWAHFRWGVFDEYGLSGEPQFYFSPSSVQMEGVRCTREIQGNRYLVNRNTSEPLTDPMTHHIMVCPDVDPKSGLYPDNCQYIPYSGGVAQNGTEASIMDNVLVRQVVKFCNDDHNNSKILHNYEAPSRHNRLCGHRSTWAVISESEDFKNGANPPSATLETIPTFHLVQSPKTVRMVLALDGSQSMAVDQKLTLMRQSTATFLTQLEKVASLIGLVTFSDTPQVRRTPVGPNISDEKIPIADYLPESASGATNISAAVLASLQLLEGSHQTSASTRFTSTINSIVPAGSSISISRSNYSMANDNNSTMKVVYLNTTEPTIANISLSTHKYIKPKVVSSNSPTAETRIGISNKAKFMESRVAGDLFPNHSTIMLHYLNISSDQTAVKPYSLAASTEHNMEDSSVMANEANHNVTKLHAMKVETSSLSILGSTIASYITNISLSTRKYTKPKLVSSNSPMAETRTGISNKAKLMESRVTSDPFPNHNIKMLHYLNISSDHTAVEAYSLTASTKPNVDDSSIMTNQANHNETKLQVVAVETSTSNILGSTFSTTDTGWGKHLLVVTDGITTEGSDVISALPFLQESGVVLSFIVLGNSPTPEFERLAYETGGRIYCDLLTGNNIVDLFFDWMSQFSAEAGSIPIQLLNRAAGLNKGESMEGETGLDKTVGASTFFIVTFTDTVPDVAIYSPTGREYRDIYPEYSLDHRLKLIQIAIPFVAQPGLWQYKVINQGNFQKVSILAIAKPVTPFTVTPRLTGTLLSKRGTPPTQSTILMFAEVTKGHDPVNDLKVYAKVSTPSGDLITMELVDNGAGADIGENDGIYSRFFSRITEPGLHTVRITAAGFWTDDMGIKHSSANLNNRFVQRSVSAGYFVIAANDASSHSELNQSRSDVKVTPVCGSSENSEDTQAPVRISDLRVVKTSSADGTVVLSWLAPGDDEDQGSATLYEVLMAPMVLDLMNLPNSRTQKLKKEDIIFGDLSDPKPFGSREYLALRIPAAKPGTNVSVVFTVMAVDDAGNKAEHSNYVSAGLGFVPDITDVRFWRKNLFETTTPVLPPSNGNNIILTAIMGCVSSLLVLSVIVSLVIAFCTNRQSHQKPSNASFEFPADNRERNGFINKKIEKPMVLAFFKSVP